MKTEFKSGYSFLVLSRDVPKFPVVFRQQQINGYKLPVFFGDPFVLEEVIVL